ncbi:MAG: adenylosuccinate lyase family protein [SAR202 cluster bacterium]|nr:adenylosuccinate lyase family protein [SAR202 cluster bacterium]
MSDFRYELLNKDISMKDMFAERNIYQAYLDVEAALARAQAQLGVIPQSAADKISSSAQIDLLDIDAIHEGLRISGHPLVPIIWELDRVCGEEAGGYIHWGATTQNITQTAKLLVVKRCHDIFLGNLGKLLNILADLAEKSKDYAMPGRTHGQHAVPMTFGHKVAVWIDEILRHIDRLKGCEERVFVTMLGGGAGTLASVGMEGLHTQELMAKELGMTSMPMPSRTTQDHQAEYVTILALFASTSTKMAREIYTLMKQEYGEAEERITEGQVGSSTMPQKRNPKRSQRIIANAAKIRVFVPLAFESMQEEHEADASGQQMINAAIDQTCILTNEIILGLIDLFDGVNLYPERMRRNLDLSGGLIMSEQIMLELGKEIGRQRAHDVVYDAAQKSVNEGRSFLDTLAEEEDVVARLSKDQIAELLDPENYMGLCSYFAETFAARARDRAKELA